MTQPGKQSDVLQCLKSWASGLPAVVNVSDVYVFGSLVSHNGARFESNRSDIDLLIRLGNDANVNAIERTRAIQGLLKQKDALETSLFKILGRGGDKPISSAVVATDWEIENGIHKDGKPDFFIANEFVNVISGSKSPLGKQSGSNAGYSGALAVIQGAQKFRNLFLAVAANGTRVPPIDENPEDPLPKNLLRDAAQLAYDLSSDSAKENKFDINSGLLYVGRLVHDTDQTISEFRNLREVLGVRMGGRGEQRGLPVEALLTCWELLAQTSMNFLKRPNQDFYDELDDEPDVRRIFPVGIIDIDPWKMASSEEELSFKKLLKPRIELANKLFNAGDKAAVIQCWECVWNNALFDPSHSTWAGKPFFQVLIQWALIDIAYAHMALVNSGPLTHLPAAYEASRRALSVPPYSIEGASDSALDTSDAKEANKCYAVFVHNLGRFMAVWPPEVVEAFGGKVEDFYAGFPRDLAQRRLELKTLRKRGQT